MTIIIPMAGLSQRFLNAGFNLPKYMLYVKNKSLFYLSVIGFKAYFNTCRFLFIARDVYDTRSFIRNECNLLGVKNFEIIILNQMTSGQAETVFKGLEESALADDGPITIFNIDTFRHNFTFPSLINELDGYLEVFRGEGSNWSYAKTASDESTKVIETAEKNPISHYCSTGLYFFKKVSLFKEAFLSEDKLSPLKEQYVAPLYNVLIKKNKNIHIDLIDRKNVDFCGIPEEYYQFIKKSVNLSV